MPGETSELLREKSDLIVLLELAKARKDRQAVRDLSSKAAVLEAQIAIEYLAKGRTDCALVNLISSASCFLDGGRYIEARRQFERAVEHTRNDPVDPWVKEQLGRLPVTVTPGEVFSTANSNIEGNRQLRRPQIEAYRAALGHFQRSREHAIVQLPVGCGKTGVMALLPFKLSNNRVLVVAPNLEIRNNLTKNLDYTSPDSFLRRLGVLRNGTGPTCATLDSDANLHDADQSDIVVTNIQQLAATGASKWLAKLTPDYFDMILLDEGHHNVAPTWKAALSRFPDAKVTSFTATPLRSDGQRVEGNRIYRFPIRDAIKEGYVKDIAARRLELSEILFTYKGTKRLHTLDEVMELREEDWFSRGVALSDECNRNIVDASIQAMRELRDGSNVNHQIIGSACTIDHAKAIRALYEERHLSAAVLHSNMKADDQQKVRRGLHEGSLDAVVQVQMLGEGADYPTLSVAAIFRPFRHLVPYVQFVGRTMRVIKQDAPGDRDNRGFVVSHVGLNVDRWWEELRSIDGDDQLFFEEIANSARDFGQSDEPAERRRFTPDMTVIDEKIRRVLQERFLPEEVKARVDDLINAMSLRGWDLESIGLSREDLENRLTAEPQPTEATSLETLHVSPQQIRKTARTRLNERVNSAAKQLLNELGLSVAGVQLSLAFRGSGAQNIATAIILLNREICEYLGVGIAERQELSTEQLQRGYQNIDEIIDRVAEKARLKLKQRNG